MAKISRTSSDGVFAVLPLRDIVVFPHMIVPLFVGREKSIKALEEVMGAEKQIMLATQKNAAEDDPAADGIYDIGTLANVLQLLKIASTNMLLCRFRVDDDLVWNLLTSHNVKKVDNATTTQLHASILMAGKFAESMASTTH